MLPMLPIAVDTEAGVAPWRQVRDQITDLVARGRLPIGAQLPAIRRLATELGLAPGTVARAYRELEAEGILRTARRHGTVVAAVPPEVDPLETAAAHFVTTAREIGVDKETALAAVARLYDASP